MTAALRSRGPVAVRPAEAITHLGLRPFVAWNLIHAGRLRLWHCAGRPLVIVPKPLWHPSGDFDKKSDGPVASRTAANSRERVSRSASQKPTFARR